MNSRLISYIILVVVTVIAAIEHAVFNLYPVSQASKAIDDTFAYLVLIAMIGTIVANVATYFSELKKKRRENMIKK